MSDRSLPRTSLLALALPALAACLLAGCGEARRADEPFAGAGASGAQVQPESLRAEAIVRDTRSRFRLLREAAASTLDSAAIDLGPRGRVAVARAPAHRAEVRLPSRAGDPFVVQDVESGLAVEVTLRGLAPSPAERSQGLVVYPEAIPSGGHVIHRPSEKGTEDFVIFEAGSSPGHVAYEVSLAPSVAGLRLFDGTLELLDESGTPRLRMARPYVVGLGGVRYPTRVWLEGCQFDDSGSPPWGRPVTPPRASRCVVHIRWRAADDGPVVLDPSWTWTGAMAYVHGPEHTATVLDPLTVLVAGGVDADYQPSASAELFDVRTRTWAPTYWMSTPRVGHVASPLAGGRALIAAGGSAASASTAEVYDPAAGWHSTAPHTLAHAAGAASAALKDGRVLLLGGGSNMAELYDPSSNTWRGAAPMTVPRAHHAAVRLSDGHVLVLGGWYEAGKPPLAELYDPAADVWTSASTLHLGDPTLTAIDQNRAFAFGGSTKALCTFVSLAQMVIPVCSELSTSGYSLYDHSVAWLGGLVLIYGDESLTVFDPASEKWSVGPAVEYSRHASASVVSPGAVLLTDGYGAQLWTFGPFPAGTPCSGDFECQCGSCDPESGECKAAPGGVLGDGGRCDTAADCPASYQCLSTRFCAPPEAVCLNDAVSLGTDGMERCCAPYRCTGAGVCGAACSSQLDCAPGFECNSGKSCGDAPEAVEAGGCAVGAAPRARSAPESPWITAVLVSVLVCRRRRRGCRGFPRRSPLRCAP